MIWAVFWSAVINQVNVNLTSSMLNIGIYSADTADEKVHLQSTSIYCLCYNFQHFLNAEKFWLLLVYKWNYVIADLFICHAFAQD